MPRCKWPFMTFRMHYVFKGCDTQRQCESRQHAMMPQCKRDWYDDWSCMECCSGDLCNYYVTLTASALTASTALVTGALTTLLLLLLNS